MEIVEIVHKLIGPTYPAGDSSLDGKRLENLKELCRLTESLISRISEIAENNEKRHEASMKEAGQLARKYLNDWIFFTNDKVSE